MPERFENGYALLIGVDENRVAEWALPGAGRDVTALQGVLTDPERCAYPVEQVRVVRGKEATRQGILDGLAWLEERVRGRTNATAVVYYTGHGWRDAEADAASFYLVPCDVREGQVRSRALRAADFAEAVGALRPQRLLAVLDCCHAGGMGIKGEATLPPGYAGAAFAPSLLVGKEGGKALGPGEEGLGALARGRGRAVLSSSTGTQRSYVRKDGRMSIFTYHLIAALIGHAQPQAGAREVLVSDLMGYVHRHVPQSARAEWGAEQTPDYAVSGNFPIALLLGGKGLGAGQTALDPLEAVAGEAARVVYHIDTGGGAVVVGDVDTGGGEFVGRDQIRGDQVRGDKVARE